MDTTNQNAPATTPVFVVGQENIVAGSQTASPEQSARQVARVRAQWRVEVTENGRYWTWRRGSGKKRDYMYGGKFETLDELRRVEYGVNREIHHARRQAAAARREQSTGIIGIRERGQLHA